MPPPSAPSPPPGLAFPAPCVEHDQHSTADDGLLAMICFCYCAAVGAAVRCSLIACAVPVCAVPAVCEPAAGQADPVGGSLPRHGRQQAGRPWSTSPLQWGTLVIALLSSRTLQGMQWRWWARYARGALISSSHPHRPLARAAPPPPLFRAADVHHLTTIPCTALTEAGGGRVWPAAGLSFCPPPPPQRMRMMRPLYKPLPFL